MTYLYRLSLGCAVIAALSGCATGALSKSDPGAQVVMGSTRPGPVSPGTDPGAGVVRGDRWWEKAGN
jgi:hypothetical protein